ncbi:MAG TPA: MarR family transcriptional regulator [Candidatus Dormibacteraeota bacterium]|nr:MarR family transcriptional regulator [Candidatus Dormibacteraeota bacterium]
MSSIPRTGLMSLVNQVSKAMNRRASEELLGMRLKQFLALSYIQDHPNVTQQELESALLVDANAVVLLLNDLETAGFVVRRRDPADRRRHLVEVTRAGKAAWERADKARTALAEEMLAGFTQAERETLRSLLQRVLDSLLSAAPEHART